jgi:hypothetical protein
VTGDLRNINTLKELAAPHRPQKFEPALMETG